MTNLNNVNVLQAINNLNLPETNLTSAQAQQVLAALVDKGQETENALRNLVNRVSTVGTGDVTVLFSGGGYDAASQPSSIA